MSVPLEVRIDHDQVTALRSHILSFYTATSGDVRESSERWLTTFTRTRDSWHAALSILELEDASEAESVFCARTIHVLLRRCVAKEARTQASHAVFSDDEWHTLRERIFSLTRVYSIKAIRTKSQHARTTLTQLALATSALACKMPSWEPMDIVSTLLITFGGQNDQSAPADSKLLCLCALLALLAQEANCRDLSIHPARRECVLDGLKAASSDVMTVLEQLAQSCQNDASLISYILEALASWAEFSDITQAFPSVIVDGAVQIVCSSEGDGQHSSILKQRAANAARTSLSQCIWYRSEKLRGLLAQHMATLRKHVMMHNKSSETRDLITEILSALAMEACREKEIDNREVNPYATGLQAAGDRVYVKYSKFKDLQRQQRKAEKKSAKARAIAIEVDEEVLICALDSLNDALAAGVAMGSALEPWSKLVDVYPAISSNSLLSSLTTVASRCISASVVHASVLNLDALDDQYKEEIGDCLRDVITIVPIDHVLHDFTEGLKAEIQMSSKLQDGWKIVRARLVILLALAKSFKNDDAGAHRPLFISLVDVLCILFSAGEDVGVPHIILESAAWVLAGLASSFACLSDAQIARVANVLIERLRHYEALIARGACVAMMKLCEHAADRLASTDVPARLAAIHATGGPTASYNLRLGQEHESTIMLRSLTFFVFKTDRAENVVVEHACVMLADPVISTMRSCVRMAPHESDYVRSLVDLDIVLQAMQKAYAHINTESSLLGALALNAAHAVNAASSKILFPENVEERFKVGWVMKALVDLVRYVGNDLLKVIVTTCIDAYALAPELGQCYVETMTIILATYGDCALCGFEESHGIQTVGQVFSNFVAETLPKCMDDPDLWPAMFTLTRATLRCGCAALTQHARLVIEISKQSLRGVSNDAAAASLLLAIDLLCAPTLLVSLPTNNASAVAMHAGLGRLAAEISGQSSKRRTDCSWNAGCAQSAPLAAEINDELVRCESNIAILRLLLECANGVMAPSMISDIAACLHYVWSVYGDVYFVHVLTRALGDDSDGFPKPKTTSEDKRLWIETLCGEDARKDARLFKRSLKAFLGGKKVGMN